jgi:hypothetical protein
LKIIFAQKNPNILLAHYFQYKKEKNKMNKKYTSLGGGDEHILNAKVFVETLQPLTFYLQ